MRTPTAYPYSLRVITQALQGFAEDCKSRIFKRFPFPGLLRVAPYCVPGGVRVVSIFPSYLPNSRYRSSPQAVHSEFWMHTSELTSNRQGE